MIDLQVYGSPASCRATAAELEAVASVADETVDVLTAAMGSVDGAWTGMAADAAAVRLEAARRAAANLESSATATKRALDAFADELAVVVDRMTAVHDDAARGGLVTGPTKVWPPVHPGPDATPDEIARYDRRATLYRSLVDRAQEARTLEATAHDRLLQAVNQVTADPAILKLLKDAGLVPQDLTPFGLSAFAIGGGLTGLGLRATWLTRVTLGRFAPRVGGRFAPIGNGWFGNRWLGPNSWRALSDSNWVARPGQAGSYGTWSTVGKWAGRAGVVVSFGVAAYDQWRTDADDPSLSTAERVGRSTAVGATTAAGGWAGAWAGAQVGGMIGTAVGGPVGTVVGGFVGGVIGGVIGSGVGQAVGGWIADGAGQVAEAVADGVGKAWDAAGDALSDIGDALSDFGDAITFWD